MSVREFAAYLGVSDRTVSKWGSGGEQLVPRPETQAILDTALEKASEEVHARFTLLLAPEQATGTTVSRAEFCEPVAQPAPEISSPKQLRHPADGKLMVLVEAGVFLSGPADETVWLPAFHIDVTPTTNADYANFVAATGHQPPIHWPDGRCPKELRNHPVVHVTHHDATPYAAWAKKALPTGAEWEKAARGDRGAVFPWGDQPTWAKCNVRESGIGRTTPVDRYHSGTSPYGVYDMSGNIWEWCSSETDPGRFILKGSAFTSPFSLAPSSANNDASADMFDDDTGFRCVTSNEALDALLKSRGAGREGAS